MDNNSSNSKKNDNSCKFKPKTRKGKKSKEYTDDPTPCILIEDYSTSDGFIALIAAIKAAGLKIELIVANNGFGNVGPSINNVYDLLAMFGDETTPVVAGTYFSPEEIAVGPNPGFSGAEVPSQPLDGPYVYPEQSIEPIGQIAQPIYDMFIFPLTKELGSTLYNTSNMLVRNKNPQRRWKSVYATDVNPFIPAEDKIAEVLHKYEAKGKSVVIFNTGPQGDLGKYFTKYGSQYNHVIKEVVIMGGGFYNFTYADNFCNAEDNGDGDNDDNNGDGNNEDNNEDNNGDGNNGDNNEDNNEDNKDGNVDGNYNNYEDFTIQSEECQTESQAQRWAGNIYTSEIYSLSPVNEEFLPNGYLNLYDPSNPFRSFAEDWEVKPPFRTMQEFNIFKNPSSAKVTFDALYLGGIKTTVLPTDSTDPLFIENNLDCLRCSSTPEGRFVYAIIDGMRKFSGPDFDYLSLWDAFAIITYLNPSVIKETKKGKVEVTQLGNINDLRTVSANDPKKNPFNVLQFNPYVGQTKLLDDEESSITVVLKLDGPVIYNHLIDLFDSSVNASCEQFNYYLGELNEEDQ